MRKSPVQCASAGATSLRQRNVSAPGKDARLGPGWLRPQASQRRDRAAEEILLARGGGGQEMMFSHLTTEWCPGGLSSDPDSESLGV